MTSTLKTLTLLIGLTLILGFACVQDAYADSIGWDTDYNALGVQGDWTPNSGSVATATVVNITLNQAQVTSATGGFADYFSVGDRISYNDISFENFQPFVLWTGAGFTFTLNSLDIVRHDKNFVTLSGEGTLAGNGIQRSGVEWGFTGKKNGNFENAAGVPEPSTLILLSVGLICLGFARSRISRRQTQS